MRAPVVVTSLVLILVLSGCSVAPKAIKRNYTTYNHTIHYNQSQQMLLNLVRMRYRESPLFMKVGAVSTSYSFDINGGGSIGSSFGEDNWGLNAGGGYSERPTVTYTPIEGDTFVKQMLAEVSLSSFVLLYRSGWPITTLSHVLVERIGRWVNHPDSNSYRDFVQYNCAFYSIGRSDIQSKDTFALLRLIFQMQAGDIQSVQPILTLPVATP